MRLGTNLEALVFRASHDLKTPVVAIGGLAQVLRRQLEATLDARQRALFDRIEANVELMSSRIDGLVELARATAPGPDASEDAAG